MADKTEIAWCDSTFNPFIGCTKVGPGCDFCYAEALMDTRYGKVKWGAGQPRARTSPANWRKPLQWNARDFYECKTCGWRGDTNELDNSSSHGCPQCITGGDLKLARRRVFCASLADVFDNEVDQAWLVDLMTLVRTTPNIDWQLLTKRVGIVLRRVREAFEYACERSSDDSTLLDTTAFLARWLNGDPPANVWLGATVVNQEEADRDIPKLQAVPAAVHFLSCEPLLGPISIGEAAGPVPAIDWVIAGGESGHHARPMHPDWARSLVEQCRAAGVAFFMKQMGGTRDKRGALEDLPTDLRVRDFPS